MILLTLGAWILACDPVADAPAVPAAPPAPDVRLVREDPSDAPLAGLSPDEMAAFDEGDALFEHPFREAQGLGPLYIHRSCTSCHEDDARGPGAVRRLVAPDGGALPYGDVVRPRLAAGARTPITAAPDVREVVHLPPAVFARGLLEAIPDAWIRAQESAQREDPAPPAGVAAVLGAGQSARLGRFGHKARSATLDDFVADALHGDMGLTSPARPDEVPNPDGLRDDARPGVDVGAHEVDVLAAYVRMLAAPAREPSAAHARGAETFASIGCATCHVPRARTRADHPIAALRDVDVAVYTDLLLHDMGDGLEDGVAEGAASGRQWRTAPLVGIRHLRGLLHDGRAATVTDAIAAHASPGSEARGAAERFAALPAADGRALVAFVEAL